MSSAADEFLLQKIGGYTLSGQTLGKGAFARVELATHRMTNSQVALKIINLNHVDEAYVRKNILRESAILKNLRHDNIVRLYETLAYKNTYCFVMEYLEGGSLLNYIREQKQKKLNEKTALKYFNQLLLAIRYLHDHGIIHRDLKLQNIMLTDNQSKVKLVDFGLSNFFNKDNLLKTQCGSAEYAAPELFDKGVEYGASVEIWSIGVVLYGMTTGRMPFEVKSHETKENLVLQIRRGLNITHEYILKKLSFTLKDLLIKTLEPDKEKRITLNEMFIHSWVVEDGRKPLLKNPPLTLPHEIRQRVIDQVAQLYQKPVGKTMELIRMNEEHSMVATYKILMDLARKSIQMKRRTHSAPSKYFRSFGTKRTDTNRPVSARPDRRSKSTLDNKKDWKFHTANFMTENLSTRRGAAETKATDTLPISSLLQVSNKIQAHDKESKTKGDSSDNELNQSPFRLSPPPLGWKNNRRKPTSHERMKSSDSSAGESNCSSESFRNSAKKSERRMENSNMIEETTEGEFELSDSSPGETEQTRRTVDIVSDKVKVSFCGENLKRGSFKVTEWKKHDENTRIRVHIPNKREATPKVNKRNNSNVRSISPNNARRMLHRHTFPLQRQEMDIGNLKIDDDVGQTRDDDSFMFQPTQNSQYYMHDERGGRLSPERISSNKEQSLKINGNGRKCPTQNWDFSQSQTKHRSTKPSLRQDDSNNNNNNQPDLSKSIYRKIFGSSKK